MSYMSYQEEREGAARLKGRELRVRYVYRSWNESHAYGDTYASEPHVETEIVEVTLDGFATDARKLAEKYGQKAVDRALDQAMDQ